MKEYEMGGTCSTNWEISWDIQAEIVKWILKKQNFRI
jgi:hypothetical protein